MECREGVRHVTTYPSRDFSYSAIYGQTSMMLKILHPDFVIGMCLCDQYSEFQNTQEPRANPPMMSCPSGSTAQSMMRSLMRVSVSGRGRIIAL